jgi:hypothetical protein
MSKVTLNYDRIVANYSLSTERTLDYDRLSANYLLSSEATLREGDPIGWPTVLITALGSWMGEIGPLRPWTLNCDLFKQIIRCQKGLSTTMTVL